MSTSTTDPRAEDDPAPLDLSGRTIDDFRLLRKLGQGGMGQVYLAEQVSLRRKVAVKLLRPDVANPIALTRFKQEAEAVARITHANIVQVYQYGVCDGLPYMALEYVEGRTLKEFIAKKGPPELPVCLSIMRQVAGALQRASELGIIHRDIKPENILLTRKGEVKVADFGLSRCLQNDNPGALNLTATGVTMGTPLYMSPEQVEGKPVDSRTDLYSFGVTCYHMFAGEPPFRGSTAFEVAVQHVQKQPVPLNSIRPDLPAALCAIVHKLLAKDPANRYQTARDVLREVSKLRDTLSGGSGPMPEIVTSEQPPSVPFEASSETTAYTAPKEARFGRRFLVGFAFVASIAAALGVGVWLASRERANQGPLPGNGEIRPADASAVGAVLQPTEREKALRALIDPVLAGNAGVDEGAISNCVHLGVLYFKDARWDEATELFAKLEKLKDGRCQKIGLLGRGIVLAMQNKFVESNKIFVTLLATRPGLVGIPLKKPKVAEITTTWLEKQAPTLTIFFNNTDAMTWLGKARLHNAENGIKESETPTYLLLKFPITEQPKIKKDKK
jgi:serine/threonine-protein kinase